MAYTLKFIKCPICKKKTLWKGNPYRPFCSRECKLADLYHWLYEEYRIKLKEEELEEEVHPEKEEEDEGV